MFASCHSDLIYDIGMHVGDDTDFYLRKGFRVVAIEANPELAAKASERFAGAIAASRLSVLNVAVAGYNGSIELLITPEKDDWSTVVPEVAKKKEAESGADFTAIEVEAIRFEPILARFGVPYYMKLDIEGAERHCLEALAGFSARPKFISIELGALNALDSLSSLGYSQFKIICAECGRERRAGERPGLRAAPARAARPSARRPRLLSRPTATRTSAARCPRPRPPL